MTKPKLKGINLIRVICAIGIICFHYVVSCSYKEFIIIGNISKGSTVIVIIFFIISGIVLEYNYSSITDIKNYYKKRIKRIFPMFYFWYIFGYIEKSIETQQLGHGNGKLGILGSILGVDGYVSMGGIGTGALIGEGFLGALIILYIIFPLLNKILHFKKCSWVIQVSVLLALYLLRGHTNILTIPMFQGSPIHSLISCIFYFFCGMLIVKLRNKIKIQIVLVTSIIIFVAVLFIEQYIPVSLKFILQALTLTIILYQIGKLVSKHKFPNKIINYLSTATYPIFLIQHLVILTLLKLVNTDTYYKAVALLIITIIMSIILATMSIGLFKLIKKLKNKQKP